MNCYSTRKSLLSYLDGELPERKRKAAKKHLDCCHSCSMLLGKLTEFWKSDLKFDTFQPSLRIWNRIYPRIQECDRRRNSLFNFPEELVRYALKAAGAVLVLAGIMTGIYLGSFPDAKELPITSDRSNGLLGKEATVGDYLGSFDDMPSQSLGGIYFTLLSGREGGKLK